MKVILFFIIACLINFKSFSSPIIIEAGEKEIVIDSEFNGKEINIYGARKENGAIVILLRGPIRNFLIREKSRISGIWVNKESALVENISSFYALASNVPLDQIENNKLLEQLQIGINNFNINFKEDDIKNHNDFQHAFFRQLIQKNLYSSNINKIFFTDDTLFTTSFFLPNNISEGIYTVEAYLIQNGVVKGFQFIPLHVYKKGFEEYIFTLATRHPVTYGILAILLAISGGWIAGLIFRKI